MKMDCVNEKYVNVLVNDIFLLFNQPINIYYSTIELHMIDFGNIRNRNYCDAWYNSDFGARNR